VTGRRGASAVLLSTLFVRVAGLEASSGAGLVGGGSSWQVDDELAARYVQGGYVGLGVCDRR
jgi:hypothetical protein